jgi:hypothetical protein
MVSLYICAARDFLTVYEEASVCVEREVSVQHIPNITQEINHIPKKREDDVTRNSIRLITGTYEFAPEEYRSNKPKFGLIINIEHNNTSQRTKSDMLKNILQVQVFRVTNISSFLINILKI